MKHIAFNNLTIVFGVMDDDGDGTIVQAQVKWSELDEGTKRDLKRSLPLVIEGVGNADSSGS